MYCTWETPDGECVCCSAFGPVGMEPEFAVERIPWDGELIYAYICKIDRIDRGRDPNQHRSDEMLPQPPRGSSVELGIG